MLSSAFGGASERQLRLTEQGYFALPGLDVMVFTDTYPEGHQGGISIIQHGVRVASNGDVRLEPTPGQWQPVPAVGERTIDTGRQLISVACTYPDPARDRAGFNPIVYPDLDLAYTISVRAEGTSVEVVVNLDKPLPEQWVGKVGLNLELYPGALFGRTFAMDETVGVFPRQLSSALRRAADGSLRVAPLARGKQLVVAPESDAQRLRIEAVSGTLELLDGRAEHTNGWFVVRTPLPAGVTTAAAAWRITAHVEPGWRAPAVVHASQVGYLPTQEKVAVIECDRQQDGPMEITLQRLQPSGQRTVVKREMLEPWGLFLRYRYYRFDFSEITAPGMYLVAATQAQSGPFRIGPEVFAENVWQPTLAVFLPVQMCHMRVNDRYRVWHGLCHMDDAVMAVPGTHHFDGYRQGPSTLTSFAGLEPVPGLAVGGWHDAGDYDLRVESQAQTVLTLALAHELFGIDLDQTTVDQRRHLVELHRPDGVPDVLQQIEHGVLTILAGYESLGRLYRGIICPTLRQYVLLGDASVMTDNRAASLTEEGKAPADGADDRWVFTEDNPRRQLQVATSLAAAARVLASAKPQLAERCLEVAQQLWRQHQQAHVPGVEAAEINLLAELLLTTGAPELERQLVQRQEQACEHIGQVAGSLARVASRIDSKDFLDAVRSAVRRDQLRVDEVVEENPFGVPYRPAIWGAGWTIQRFGVTQYLLHRAWPELVPRQRVTAALEFVLGCHPGANAASFVSGVGATSQTVAYGVNRADWSYIPGGVISGTALIRPDFAELKDWPYLWQQTEYVAGGGASNFLFLVLAVQELEGQQSGNEGE